MPLADQGRADVARAAEELAQRLPRSLEPLARLAYNYRWSWLEGAPELFEAIDAERFDACAGNPVRLLQETSLRSLARAAADDHLVSRARDLHAELAAELEQPADTGVISESRPVAFFCAEYGVHASLPVYSGGLGALAGDLLKEASDRALPMVAVGLMYGKGYFRQRVDASGWQHEYWISTDPQRLPAALVTDEAGEPATIEVPLADGRDRGRRGSGGSTSAGSRCSCWTPTSCANAPLRAVDHGAPVRRRRRHSALPVRAARDRGARALRALGIHPARCI